ncbi:MAG: FAD-dependent monooxygenase, partial [Propionibacteriaceae bacterium]|nr:FAD-dependent monooxygenase [Propionibacteriaceae bacterium]
SIGLPHGIRRWEFMLFDNEPSEKVEDDSFVADLLREHVPDSSRLDVIRRRVFTHHGRIATGFRKGRALIAGDAAHLMPVWMGQGWNSGMRDATNLAWKLAAVLAGQASDHLLDTYDVERRDHAKAMIDLSMTFGTIIKPTDKAVAFLRDSASRVLNLSPQVKEYFTDMRFKPMPRYGRGVVVEPDTMKPGESAPKRTSRFMTVKNAVDKRSPVGLQFIQPKVATAEGTGMLLDDAIGPWWTVAAWGNDPARLLSEADLRRLDALGAKRVAFMSETQRAWAEKEYAGSGSLVVGDLDGSLKGWFDTRGMGVVFLRPDRFVAAACLAQDASRALDALFRAMSATVDGSLR